MAIKLPFDLESLLSNVQEHEAANRPKVDSIMELAEPLLEAARKVGDSWSGSCMGYHCELYYGDFQKPPLGDRFNVEWGGTHGLPNGWRPREAEDVKGRIESLANSEFSRLEQNDKALTHSLEEFRTEIAIELTPLRSIPNLTDEKELLRKIDALEWGEKDHKEYCATAVRSSPHSTRDSSAIMEGFRLPAHTYYEAIAHQALKHSEAAKEFWRITKRLIKQLQVLQSVDGTEVSGGSRLDLVKVICTRFHGASRQLLSRREGRPTLEIHDEHDVQDLLHGFLRLHFDDIRPEEWTPSYGGGSARMDFLLKTEQIVLEAKMARTGRDEKKISEELIVDAARYKGHPDCKILVCFVYDPEGVIRNPRGVEKDLSRLSVSDLEVIAIVSS